MYLYIEVNLIQWLISLLSSLKFFILFEHFVDEKDGKSGEAGFISLYRKLQEAVGSLYTDKHKSITIVVDDISSMEVAANGSSDDVLSLLHYCYTLTSEFVR